jgi:hypothetical protein
MSEYLTTPAGLDREGNYRAGWVVHHVEGGHRHAYEVIFETKDQAEAAVTWLINLESRVLSRIANTSQAARSI